MEGAARELAERSGIAGIDAIVAFSVPLTTRFRGVEERHGLLLHGPAGWGEWSPFDEYDDAVAAVWLRSAIASACDPAPPALRDRIPVNVTVPAVSPAAAHRMVEAAGCSTAKVKVAEPGQHLHDDAARIAAVRDALGPDGRIRIDANAAWSADSAVEALGRLEQAAGGLEYVEQPCATLPELAEVRSRTGIPIAADETIRRDHVDLALLRDAVDVAVVKVQPSGGMTEVLRLARTVGLPVVISSALETSIGLATGIRAAAALERLDHACGLGTALLLREDVTSGPLVPHDGSIDVRAAQETLWSPLLVARPPSPVLRRRLLERLARAERERQSFSG